MNDNRNKSVKGGTSVSGKTLLTFLLKFTNKWKKIKEEYKENIRERERDDINCRILKIA